MPKRGIEVSFGLHRCPRIAITDTLPRPNELDRYSQIPTGGGNLWLRELSLSHWLWDLRCYRL